MINKRLYIYFFLIPLFTLSQNIVDVNANLDTETNQIIISQYIEYKNTTTDTLTSIYLNDWSHSYSSKKTPLAIRFAEEFNSSFHFAKHKDRGFTFINEIKNNKGFSLSYKRLKKHPDVIVIKPKHAVLPNTSYKLKLSYIVQLPDDKFTQYGITNTKDYKLKYWYITPAVYNGNWHYYSNKDLDDFYTPSANITLKIKIPKNYALQSELDVVTTTQNKHTKTLVLEGKNRIDTKLFVFQEKQFKNIKTDYFTLLTNIKEEDITDLDNILIIDRIASFLSSHLGQYPHNKLMVTNIESKKDPIYGLNQLPKFIRPFPEHFQYELQLLKTALGNYLDNILHINPRQDHWLKDAFQIYFLIKYVEEQYPKMKLIGTLANVWGLRSFHIADLDFNEQYGLVYSHMSRTNRDQPLRMAKDSLLRFNRNLASKYKAGIGLKYLEDYINTNTLEDVIKVFLETNRHKITSSKAFERFIKSKTTKHIDWFFEDYLETRNKIDYKIKTHYKSEDSITFSIINKQKNKMPISLFALKEDSIISKDWLDSIQDQKTFTFSRYNIDKLVLNYDKIVPEYNLRNNWKSTKGFFFNNRPLQIRIFKDVEDPDYNQVFVTPLIEFRNIYDGLLLGANIDNKTIIRRALAYKVSPQYATKSKQLTGNASIVYRKNIEKKQDLYHMVFGLSGRYSSYAPDLFSTRITPFIRFNFRDHTNFRSNKFQSLTARFISINRDQDINNISDNDDPDYNVFNLQYSNGNPGLIDFNHWFTDFQLSKNFGKLSFNYEYRKLFESNRQLNLRFFAGTFLYNDNPSGFDFFSFALDRPTDYLFDYQYLGRSEDSGIFSQQLIIAEGGFKSQLKTPFANQWITSFNASTTLWKYVQIYGDIGFVKNKFSNPNFVYDSGIRLNLVTDYFELYLPIYSNLGWEIGQPNYDQKIRFIFTVDPQSLLGLFRRKWY